MNDEPPVICTFLISTAADYVIQLNNYL